MLHIVRKRQVLQRKIKRWEFTTITHLLYGKNILLSLTSRDALANETTIDSLAKAYLVIVEANLNQQTESFVPVNIFLKIGLTVLILLGLWLALKLIAFLDKKTILFIEKHKSKWLKSLTYNNYTFITPEQELTVILSLVKIVKWVLILLIVLKKMGKSKVKTPQNLYVSMTFSYIKV